VFENRVLRGIFGPKGNEVTGQWRKLHNGELHNLYSSPDIIRQIKSRRISWAGHVARMGKGRKVCKILVGQLEERDYSVDGGVGGRMGSKWMLGRMAGRVWNGFTWFRIGIGGGLL
jgi:hypothetical protein